MNQKEQLEEQIRQLTQTIEKLNRRVALLEGGAGEAPAEPNGQPTRRRFLRIGAAAAAGAVGLAAGKVLPATATTGGNVVLGSENTADLTTTVKGEGGTPPKKVFAAQDLNHDSASVLSLGPFSGTLQGLGGSGAVEGVDGWAKGASAFGVYGLTDAGWGVVGESDTGISLYARRSGRIQQDPISTTPQNDIPTPGAFEMVRDGNGAMWISGPGNTWMRPSLNVFPDPRRMLIKTVAVNGVYGPFDARTKSGGGSTGVPLGAQAAYCAVQSFQKGLLTLFPFGTSDPHIANYSGAVAGALNMLYVLVPIDGNGKFMIRSYMAGTVYIDVWGFLI